MSTNYKYQEQFAMELAELYLKGGESAVRLNIRNLKNKAQSAFISAQVALSLLSMNVDPSDFCKMMHPNNQ